MVYSNLGQILILQTRKVQWLLRNITKPAIPDDIQAKSLRQLLKNNINDDDFRDAIYYHYYDFPAFHMVKKSYGIHRTKRYKLIHVYDDIDQWELYDLKTDPKELHNLIDDDAYEDIERVLRIKFGTLQEKYLVTEKEFEKASPESIQRSYKNFERLRGQPMEAYKH